MVVRNRFEAGGPVRAAQVHLSNFRIGGAQTCDHRMSKYLGISIRKHFGVF